MHLDASKLRQGSHGGVAPSAAGATDRDDGIVVLVGDRSIKSDVGVVGHFGTSREDGANKKAKRRMEGACTGLTAKDNGYLRLPNFYTLNSGCEHGRDIDRPHSFAS